MSTVTVNEQKSQKGKIILIVLLALVVVLAVVALIGMTDSTGISLDSETKEVMISDDANTFEIASLLKDEDVIEYPYMFILQSFVGGYHGNFRGGKIVIKDNMSYGEILDNLIMPMRNSSKIVVAEGQELREISQQMNDMGIVPWQDFYAALGSVDYYDYPWLRNIPLRDNLFEGYIYPATYEIAEGMNEYNIAELMFDTFNSQFPDEYYQKAEEIGITTDQLVILASIVQREAPENGDLNRIAGVYYNRFKAGFCMESTGSIQYILGERKPVLSIADTQLPSPYNTFTNAGLPIGAICSPGKAAIEAVLNYSQNNEYYYGLREDGTTFFATNYAEYKTQLEAAPLAVSVDIDVFKNQDNKIPS